MSAVFYYDVFSPYVYMSAERIDGLLPDADWRPIDVFSLRKLNGRSAWVFSDERPERMREIETRAAGYGLPPITWPQRFPGDLRALGLAATVSKEEGREREFALAVGRAIYARGAADASEPAELGRIADEAGLDSEHVLSRMREPAIEAQLTARIEEAHAAGAPGVPTFVVDGEVFWGDDRLDEAAMAAAPG